MRRVFDVFAKFFFTTSETELHYFHQKVSARVASRELGNFQKIPEMFRFHGEYSVNQPKAKF